MNTRIALKRTSLLLVVALPELSFAQEESSGTAVRREPGTPIVRVVGFRDYAPEEGGDCDQALARVGQCVELVRFLDPDHIFDDSVASDRVERAEWRNIGTLYGEIWEDLSYRWKNSEAVQNVFWPYGVERIPTTGAHWEAVSGGPGEPTYAMPHSDYWVHGDAFLPADPAANTDTSVYRYLRYFIEPGLPTPTPYALLQGRFAKRMVYDEEPRKFDMMDADPSTSAPFFEHLYPYRTARFFGANDLGFTDAEGETLLDIPLSNFEVPAELRTPPRLARYLTPGVGTDETLLLDDAQVRALEEHITRARIRRAGYAPLVFVPGDDIEGMRSIASREYEAFYQDIGAQVVKFGRENYTPTHIRVLTALFAIQSPPGTNRSFVEADLEREVEDLVIDLGGEEIGEEAPVEVPATPELEPLPGEEEDLFFYYEEEAAPAVTTTSEGLYEEDTLSDGRQGVRISYAALPPRLIRAHLDHLSPLQPMDEAFAQYLHDAFSAEPDRRGLLKDRARSMSPEGDESILEWITRYAARYAKGANERTIEEGMSRLALERIVRDQRMRQLAQGDLLETAMLLDHVRYAFVDRFDPNADPANWAPAPVVEAASLGEWINVLAQHDYFPVPLDAAEELRNPWYDPLSVCTQSEDFRAAAEEGVFGAVNLDLLLVAPDRIPSTDPWTALWAARERVPFMMVDDPRAGAQQPELKRIVGLPDGRAVYRVRWRVWTGWHLFWTTESLGDVQWRGEVPPALADSHLSWMRRHFDWLREWAGTPVVAENAHRVALRTGAVCSDLVLADPEVVPSLVRAAMLDQDFRPTTPYDRGAEGAPRIRSDDARFVGREIGNRNVDERTQAEGAADVGSQLADENSLDPITGILPRRNDPEDIAYVRGLVLPNLQQVKPDPATLPSMFFVFDTVDARTSQRTRQMSPRVPYYRYQRDGGKHSHVRTAAWALAVPPADYGRPRMLSPDWVDTDAVNAEDMNPRWRQRRTAHFTVFGDLGLRPIHLVRTKCSASIDGTRPDVASTIAPCDPDADNIELSSGISATYGVLQTLWLASNRQIAVEYGVVATGTLTFRPFSFIYPKADRFQSLRYYIQAGPIVGIRGTTRPGPLFRGGGGSSVWGAKDRDESTNRQRMQYGLRVGIEFGPSYNGLETQLLGDGWVGWSVTPSRAKNRMFTSYHPSFLIGPYVQGGYSRTVAAADDDRQILLDLGWSTSLNVGLRIQARLFNYGGTDPAAAATGAL